jgi:hypothetical protein
MAILNFNATDVAPSAPLEALPAGTYECVITDSEMLPTKAGNGQFLKLTFEVSSGEHAGRKLWARLNLDNPSKTAVEIARAELSAICHAVGVLTPQDSSELHNLPLLVTVKVRQLETGAVNDIKGYAAVKRAPAPAPAPKSAATGVAPWQR